MLIYSRILLIKQLADIDHVAIRNLLTIRRPELPHFPTPGRLRPHITLPEVDPVENGKRTLFALAAVAACGSCSLGYPSIYGGYPGVYSGHDHHGYRGVHPIATYGSAVHSPLAYNHVGYNTIPYAPIQSQYHAQDELGQYSFGYSGGPSDRSETRDAFGNVRGSYNYIDAEGKVQTQHYVADALGFRVSGTNLPVGPEAPVFSAPLPEPVQDTPEVAAAKAAHQAAHDEAITGVHAAPLALSGPLPEPVQDTPEVTAAKAAHQAAYDEAAAAAEASPERKKRSVFGVPALGAYSPRGFSYGFSAPLSYGYSSYGAHHGYPSHGAYHSYGPYTHGAHAYPAHPSSHITRDATLLRVVNNPGHAVSYRVD
ncbi:uncharacterized protein [Palaemon carinicauda]|uniref:uncharacterized protein n=1 Tax=Palaemon carinicauda TaxID=392227 RepID=UPI0035B58832